MRRFTLLLALAGIARAQVPNFAPYHANGIYDIGEKAGWTVSGGQPNASYHYTIRQNNRDVLRTGTLDLSAGTASLEASLEEPAMLYVEVTSPELKAPIHLGAAIAPFRLQPSVPRPADFDGFWD